MRHIGLKVKGRAERPASGETSGCPSNEFRSIHLDSSRFIMEQIQARMASPNETDAPRPLLSDYDPLIYGTVGKSLLDSISQPPRVKKCVIPHDGSIDDSSH
jgi:hypothetical protein